MKIFSIFLSLLLFVIFTGGPTASEAAKPKPGVQRTAKKNPTPKVSTETAAFQQAQTQATLGDPEAQFQLGLYYETGKGTAKSEADAATWYRMAAEQGHISAQYNLAGLYAEGRGVPQNWSLAAYWYQHAADQNDPKAQYNLAQLYRYGRGVPKSEESALKWYQQAARKGVAEAAEYLNEDMGFSCLKRSPRSLTGVFPLNSDFSKTLRQQVDSEQSPNKEAFIGALKNQAEKGDPNAQIYLASLYESGILLPQDQQEAVRWYAAAAGAGHPTAQTKMGYFFEQGIHAKKSHEEAVCWFQLAADAHIPYAQYRIAYHLLHGQGIRQNPSLAIEWLKRAAEAQQSDAQVLLGRLHEEGVVVPKNHSEAVRWYQLAARADHPEGQYWLAQAYQKGLGIEVNVQEAIRWYQLAASNGDHKSALMLQSMNIEAPRPGQPVAPERSLWSQFNDWLPSAESLFSAKPTLYHLSPPRHP